MLTWSAGFQAMEDEARDLYSFMTDSDPLRVGFVTNGRAGASPDSLIGDRAAWRSRQSCRTS